MMTLVLLILKISCSLTVFNDPSRLSDYLFAAARFAAKHDKLEENVYKKAKSGREASIQTRSL